MRSYQDDLDALIEQVSVRLFSGAIKKHFKAHEILFQSGDDGDGCHRIERGVVKIVLNSQQGEERIVSIVGPGSLVGELSLIDRLPRSASVVAIRDCDTLFVTREQFVKCTQQHPKIYEYLTMMLALRLRDADEAMAASSFMSVKGRLAHAMLELAQHLGQPDSNGRILLGDRVSQNELASLAGVARENVSRTLAEWSERKLVTQSARHYCIENLPLLRKEMDVDKT